MSVMALKIPKVQLLKLAGSSILTQQEFISLKIVVHILFAVLGVFLKIFL